MTKFFIMLIIMVLATVAFVYSFDTSMDNKDEMLCNSAKVSGNEKYLKKCSCFYAGENIRCIYRKDK